jgi:hypothetical protein
MTRDRSFRYSVAASEAKTGGSNRLAGNMKR